MAEIHHLIRALPDATLHEIGDHLLAAYAAVEKPGLSESDRLAVRNSVAEVLGLLGLLSERGV
ncbi:hypothetical protein ORIO_06440 [Cereibacter azotoformans]|uniref:hypothetical protein n=1 Tax=Cereibacter azotoformans TaxID=43057 RepID=UPI001EEC2AFC|nr:hypothetical protein [Cereibacter azotoformans]ULB09562.1 hypothetical protein ORIO_06440 [Cereibacter azotoformans]